MSKPESFWDHPYLRTQLIAYIGNKRALLPFLGELFRERGLKRGLKRGGNRGLSTPRFLDPFAGSGAVSRLAKYLGFAVVAGDWECYSYVINRAHLGVDPTELAGLFSEYGGIDALLSELNGLYPGNGVLPGGGHEPPAGPLPPGWPAYIARHYAPAATESADYRRERLFYTRENALFIDAVRNRIEELYPGSVDSAGPEKALLLASLLYQAATHANTSGVFKAHHKGFGGHGGDALGRILRPMVLQSPVLYDGAARAEVRRSEAERLARGRSFEVAYLDPPYTGHQYGSNYFMLNTIARWDKPPVPEERGSDGRFKEKAGIRSDWRRTRSAYCYRGSAPEALRRLVDSIDAGRIYLSYNTEGIIPFEELIDIMESRGRVELFLKDYTVYRGGKQSIRRATRNAELVLLVTTNEAPRPRDRRRIEEIRLLQEVQTLLHGRFVPEKLRSVQLEGVDLETAHGYRITRVVPPVEELTVEVLETLRDALDAARVGDHFEEITVLGRLLSGTELPPPTSREYQRRVLWCLRKFSFRRYRAQFEEAEALLRDVLDEAPEELSILRSGLEKEVARAGLRM
ncbi:MAG: DNA adenine methylase [Spirochaetaceae bacterium]